MCEKWAAFLRKMREKGTHLCGQATCLDRPEIESHALSIEEETSGCFLPGRLTGDDSFLGGIFMIY